MTFYVVIIVAIREKENKKKKTVRQGGGAERVKNDDESIACQFSVGSGGFFFLFLYRTTPFTLYKFIYSVLSPSTHVAKKSRRHWDRHSQSPKSHRTFARFFYYVYHIELLNIYYRYFTMMVYKHSIRSLNSSEQLEQSVLSSTFLATGYFVNTYIINNG